MQRWCDDTIRTLGAIGAQNPVRPVETNEQALNVWMFDTPYSFIANKKVKGLNGFRQNPFGNFSPKPWIAETWIEK